MIAYKPDPLWLKFLNGFKSYDIFVVADDNDVNYEERYGNQYPDVNFIQIANQECENDGYISVATVAAPRQVSGWEKSLYYFSRINIDYENIWYIEDDVFIHREKTLLDIDAKYLDSDILAASCDQRKYSKSWWHWKYLDIRLERPHYKSMVCATRLSRVMLSYIDQYAMENNKLFFLEALFPTIAQHYRLRYDTPAELSSIVFRKHWQVEELDSARLFHPNKDVTKHTLYREVLDLK